jgi:hypothetical protein
MGRRRPPGCMGWLEREWADVAVWHVGPAPRWQNPPKTATNPRGVLNVWFVKFVDAQYLILRLGINSQTAHIDKGCGTDLFPFIYNWHELCPTDTKKNT